MKTVETVNSGPAESAQKGAENLLEKLAKFNGRKPALILFWGPPDDSESDTGVSEADREFLENYDFGVPTLGASTKISIVGDEPCRMKWLFVAILSEYLTATPGIAGGPKEWDSETPDKVFKKLTEAMDPTYFRGPTKPLPIKMGGNGVRYRRPAMLYTYLPGSSSAEGVAGWPNTDRDYDIVETISINSCKGLAVFGGSASSGFEETYTWVFANPGNKRGRLEPGGTAALLIESDLSFGSACKHGFKAVNEQEPIRLGNGIEDSVALASSRYRRGRPRRYHTFEDPLHKGGPPISKVEAPPRDPGYALFKGDSPDESLSAYVVLELGETFLNIPYEPENPDDPKEENWVRFLRPLESGTPLYRANATRRSVAEAPRKAANEAVRRGAVMRPAVALAVNCFGRLALLGEEDAPTIDSESIAGAKKFRNHEVDYFAYYSDGETCAAKNGLNFHWNWSSSILVIGRDFHEEYLVAAGQHFMSELVSAIHEPDDGLSSGEALRKLKALDGSDELSSNRVLERLLKQTQIIAQSSSVHIRVLSHDKDSDEGGPFLLLCKKDSTGPMAVVVPEKFSIAHESDADSLSVRAYSQATGDPIVERASEYFEKRQVGIDILARASDEERARLEELEWLASIPIRLEGSTLGVLSINSDDPDFDTFLEAAPTRSAIETMVNCAAFLLNAMVQNRAHQKTLEDACKADSKKALGQAFVDQGAKLLGPAAYLSIFFDDDDGNLTCLAVSGPEKIDLGLMRISTDPGSLPGEQGVCGWLYRQEDRDSVFLPDIRKADGKDGRPKFRPCLQNMDIGTECAVKLIDPDERAGQRPLGILNAEAPHGALNESKHGPLLQQLAKSCVPLVRRIKQMKAQEEFLQKFLPSDIAKELKDQRGPELDEFRPERRFLGILYADIRRYTRLSNIVGEERMLEFLQQYYDLVASEIAGQMGHVDKFMGDGVFALFGTTESLYETAGNEEQLKAMAKGAIDAGLGISRRFAVVAAEVLPDWRRVCPEIGFDERLEVGISVHIGRPLVGLYQAKAEGAKIGHLSYTALGKDMNLAARVGNDVDRNRVAITTPVWQLLRTSFSEYRYKCSKPVKNKYKGFGKIETRFIKSLD